MYFAKFKMNGFLDRYADIAVFINEKDWREWLNFEDDFTRMFGVDTKEDHEFDRISVSEEEARKIVDFDKLVADTYNSDLKWFLRSHNAKVYKGCI
jgi:hypothetical protein